MSTKQPLLSLNNPLVLAFGIFLILKLANIAPKLSDEGFYFYTAKLVSEGQIPYQDFFFQHLPGQILLLAGIIKAFGYNLYLLKTIPILASLGTAIVLYFLTLKSPTIPILFLFSLSVLATTDHSTGVHEAVFFLVLTWFLLDRQKFFFAGIVLFLGLTYRIYILPAALGITLYYFLANLKIGNWKLVISGACRFAIGNSATLIAGLIPYVALNLTLWNSFGEKFLTPVWHYHFLKSEGIDKGKIFSFFLANEWMLLGLALIGLFIFIANNFQIPNSKLVVAAVFGLLAQAIFLLVFADIYYFYLVILIPFLSVLAAYALEYAVSSMQHVVSNTQHAVRNKPILHTTLFILLIFAAINVYNYQTNHASVSVVTNLDRIRGDVKGLTREDSTVWGSFVVTPLIALESDRKITENQVDTNAKRNYAGFLSTDEATRLATESSLFIQTATLDTSGKIVALDPDYVKQYVIQDSCELFRTYPIPRDYEKNAILLWQCRRP